MKSRYDLFDEFVRLGEKVRLLGGIVQNEIPDGVEMPDEEILNWNDVVDECISELNSLKENTIRFYKK